MIAVERTTLLLLAAGRSTRFGEGGSKLDQDFLGKALGLHVAVALEDMPFLDRIAIVDGARIDYTRHHFRTIANEQAGSGLAGSVRLGVAAAKESGADAVLIALADMPRVTATHIYRMFDRTEGADSVVSSSDGCAPKPPALFGRDRFEFLLNLDGEHGARDLVRAGRHVVTTPAELIDVDTPQELERLRELVNSSKAVTRG